MKLIFLSILITLSLSLSAQWEFTDASGYPHNYGPPEYVFIESDSAIYSFDVVGPLGPFGYGYNIYKTIDNWTSVIGLSSWDGWDYYNINFYNTIGNRLYFLREYRSSSSGGSVKQQLFFAENQFNSISKKFDLASYPNPIKTIEILSNNAIYYSKVINGNTEIYSNRQNTGNPKKVSTINNISQVSKFQFVSMDEGYFLGQDTNTNIHLFKTSDAGVNWSVIYSDSSGKPTMLRNLKNDSLVMANRWGEISIFDLLTDSLVRKVKPATHLYDIEIFPSGEIIFSSDTGSVYFSKNSGSSWTNYPTTRQIIINDLKIVDDSVVYAVEGVAKYNRRVFEISPQAIGLNEFKKDKNEEFRIYPNPANVQLNISFNGNSNQLKQIDTRIFDLAGQEIMRSTQAKLDLSDIPNGIYLIHISKGKKTQISKFVVQH